MVKLFKRNPFKIAAFFTLLAFLGTAIPLLSLAQTPAAPRKLIDVSPTYSFPSLKGLRLDPADPLHIEFIIDTADKKTVSEKDISLLIRYFLAGLTIPEQDIWVNLSPYEQNRIAPRSLAGTDMGRDLLSQDYLLKQLAASLTCPENTTGKNYWTALYRELTRLFRTTNIPIDTFHKIWIVPGKAEVYENKTTAIITRAELKAMSEEDFLAAKNNNQEEKNIAQETALRLMKTLILPKIQQDVNQGKNFALLRQVYNSLILSVWFKRKFKESLYKHYIDRAKISGVDLDDKTIKDKIYQQYMTTFKKGLYDYVKKEYDPVTGKNASRRYFSGGFSLMGHLFIQPAANPPANGSSPMMKADIRLGKTDGAPTDPFKNFKAEMARNEAIASLENDDSPRAQEKLRQLKEEKERLDDEWNIKIRKRIYQAGFALGIIEQKRSGPRRTGTDIRKVDIPPPDGREKRNIDRRGNTPLPPEVKISPAGDRRWTMPDEEKELEKPPPLPPHKPTWLEKHTGLTEEEFLENLKIGTKTVLLTLAFFAVPVLTFIGVDIYKNMFAPKVTYYGNNRNGLSWPEQESSDDSSQDSTDLQQQEEKNTQKMIELLAAQNNSRMAIFFIDPQDFQQLKEMKKSGGAGEPKRYSWKQPYQFTTYFGDLPDSIKRRYTENFNDPIYDKYRRIQMSSQNPREFLGYRENEPYGWKTMSRTRIFADTAAGQYEVRVSDIKKIKLPVRAADTTTLTLVITTTDIAYNKPVRQFRYVFKKRVVKGDQVITIDFADEGADIKGDFLFSITTTIGKTDIYSTKRDGNPGARLVPLEYGDIIIDQKIFRLPINRSKAAGPNEKNDVNILNMQFSSRGEPEKNASAMRNAGEQNVGGITMDGIRVIPKARSGVFSFDPWKGQDIKGMTFEITAISSLDSYRQILDQ